MSQYITVRELLEHIDEYTIVNLVNLENRNMAAIDFDDAADPLVDRLNKVIIKSQTEIDPYLEQLGILPLETVPEIIKNITATFAIKRCYSFNPNVELSENLKEEIKLRYKQLEQIRTKKIPIGVTEDAAQPASEIVVNKTSSDRIFDKTFLDKI